MFGGLRASSFIYLNLSDELWVSYVEMESLHPDVEEIIVALQSNRSLQIIRISGDVLAAIGENYQGCLVRSRGNLTLLFQIAVYSGAGSSRVINMRVLTDALSETSNGIKALLLSGVKNSRRSEVEQLARGLKTRIGSLDSLVLSGIVLDVEDRTGFLEPILLALAPVPGRGESSDGASLVSLEALGAFFAEEPVGRPRACRVFLYNLGLNDNHCEAMAQELERDDALLRPIDVLDLAGNLSIGQHGYEALLRLLNRKVNIGSVKVDDQSWQTTFDLVIFMNRACHRGRFLAKGVFPSKAMLVNFLSSTLTATAVKQSS